ncbi:hypothetical protein GCM10016455_32320 [Aliiroseovarius zhejiangensis]|uniref:Uncharacterized protein n=1 Tax=Aliiroseovarius zhejiangensis TaxID=1632025 RepID=A0ABQ3JB84_9RHOB|nr:hypothetical protein [Aliiroseovarius zhejiangensis]GHF08891.1 hypothetical protein GCM10016455_32320 [Aliiroseovarius zhejiangensis]
MREDTFIVIGIIVLALSIPSFLSAIRDGRAPRVPAIMFMIGGVLIAMAIMNRPGGYQIEDIFTAFRTVFGRLKVMLTA